MADLDRVDWGRHLSPWSPPLPNAGQVVLASHFGDVFVEGPDGVVWWLNAHEDRVEKAAKSHKDFFKRVEKDPATYLRKPLIDQLIKANQLIPVGAMYGLKTPIAEGGRWTIDNVGAASIADAFAYLGSLHLQRKRPN
jgi:hypothetical protein